MKHAMAYLIFSGLLTSWMVYSNVNGYVLTAALASNARRAAFGSAQHK